MRASRLIIVPSKKILHRAIVLLRTERMHLRNHADTQPVKR